jgi:hypothetical protein
VVLGAILARELRADLDIVLARKLRAPGNPEVAIGAVAETGEVFFNHYAKENFEAWRDHLALEIQHQRDEMARRRALFRQARPPAPLDGRSVILTDDGIATGSTMLAALQVLRHQAPQETLVAVPVGAPDRVREIRAAGVEVLCLLEPAYFYAIGYFYADFHQVTDAEVLAALGQFAPSSPAETEQL